MTLQNSTHFSDVTWALRRVKSLNGLFNGSPSLTTKTSWMLGDRGPLCGEFTGEWWIRPQRASNAEIASVSWRHHRLSNFVDTGVRGFFDISIPSYRCNNSFSENTKTYFHSDSNHRYIFNSYKQLIKFQFYFSGCGKLNNLLNVSDLKTSFWLFVNKTKWNITSLWITTCV